MKKLLPLVVAGLSLPLTAAANDLMINGFMNVTAGVTDTDEITSDGYDDTVSFDRQTMMGLQLYKQVNDKTSATVQLVARGYEDFDVKASWLYFTYAISDNTEVRMGRLRTPLYHFSDFLEVGYAYNWISPPSIMYLQNEFSSFNGADITHRFSLDGGIDGSVQGYIGRFSGTTGNGVETYEMSLKPTGGVVGNMTKGDFTVRAGAHYSNLTLELDPTGSRGLDQFYAGALFFGLGDDFQIEDSETRYLQFSTAYDNGSTSFIAEWTSLTHETSALLDNQTWMIGGAQRFGDKTLHLTYVDYSESTESGLAGSFQAAAEKAETSTILGMRWDYDSSTAFKAEAEYNDEETVSGADGEAGMIYRVGMALLF